MAGFMMFLAGITTLSLIFVVFKDQVFTGISYIIDGFNVNTSGMIPTEIGFLLVILIFVVIVGVAFRILGK